MEYDHYANFTIDGENRKYWFTSTGPKGKIIKVVRFDSSEHPDINNLLFGNLNRDGSIDDKVIDDNKDRNKIIRTVVNIIYKFTSFYPDKLIFFSGSTPARTRLFRMTITNNHERLNKDFYLYGVYEREAGLARVPLKKNEDYFAFAIKRKTKPKYEKEKRNQGK